MKLLYRHVNHTHWHWGRKLGLGSLDRAVLWLILESAQDRRQLSIREIMQELELTSPNHVIQCLCRLEKLGLIKRESKLGRTIRPTCRVEFFEEAPLTGANETV